jgi:hypothetical protein
LERLKHRRRCRSSNTRFNERSSFHGGITVRLFLI